MGSPSRRMPSTQEIPRYQCICSSPPHSCILSEAQPSTCFLSWAKTFTKRAPTTPRKPIASHIPSAYPGYPYSSVTILPALASTPLPTVYLQSRGLALKVIFRVQMSSSRTGDILSGDFEKLRAIGNPLQIPPDPPLQDGRPVVPASDGPM